jgi:hypothetical protein
MGKKERGINSLGMIVSALQVMTAERDATANKISENWTPLSIYFPFNHTINFFLAFALKYRNSRIAGTVFSE